MSMALEGLDELRRTLTNLKDKGVKKAAKAGINAGLQPLISAIRSQVNSAPISADLKKEVRATIGKRLQKVGDDYVGKAGFGVGKSSKSKKVKAATRHGEKGGVGISSANIHWFVLGTAERFTGSKQAGGPKHRYRKNTGNAAHATGKIEPVLAGFVAKAAESAESRITAAAASKISAVLTAEATGKT
jgi:hypothetical protein